MVALSLVFMLKCMKALPIGRNGMALDSLVLDYFGAKLSQDDLGHASHFFVVTIVLF